MTNRFAIAEPHRQVALLLCGIWIVATALCMAPHFARGPLPAGFALLVGTTFGLGMGFSILLSVQVFATRGWTLPARIIGMTAVALGAALIHSCVGAVLTGRIKAADGVRMPSFSAEFLYSLLPFSLLYAFVAAALGLLVAHHALRDRERRLAEARETAHQAQIAALRFQLNPHFLFNTLNAISSLIVTDRAGEAEVMTEKLAGFLRASLEADPQTEVTLDDEFATLQAYLDIESVRFGDRLAIEFHCPATILDALLPSFLLQPLVENAVKYAVAPSRTTVTIAVGAWTEGTVLRLRVRDDGGQAFGIQPRPGTGVGLTNVRRRLQDFYGDEAGMEAVANARGFQVDLHLPLHTASGRSIAA